MIGLPAPQLAPVPIASALLLLDSESLAYRTPQLSPVPTADALLLYLKDTANRLAFLRATCFAPATTTLCKAIDIGYSIGLNSPLIRIFPSLSPQAKAPLINTDPTSRPPNLSAKMPSSKPSPAPQIESAEVLHPTTTTPSGIQSHYIYAACAQSLAKCTGKNWSFSRSFQPRQPLRPR